jgi:DNA-binding transcriptional LysR family regulator
VASGPGQAPAGARLHEDGGRARANRGDDRAPSAGAEDEIWRFQGSDGSVETVRVSGPLTSTNPAFLHRIALAGHGVVIGPSFTFGTDIAERRLVRAHFRSMRLRYRTRPIR